MVKRFIWIIFIFLISCKTKKSLDFGEEGFICIEVEIPPQMVFVNGGVLEFTNVRGEKFRDTLLPFCISQYEETNAQYRGYLKYLKRYKLEKEYVKALPDTTLWMREKILDDLKETLVKEYFRSPVFDNYPVVGLSAEQVKNYAHWKTDRMNEMILIREGLLDIDTLNTDPASSFSTDAYLSGTWPGQLTQKLPSFDGQTPERNVRMEDGIFLPRLRLPTLSEWEMAARAIGDDNGKYPELRKKWSFGKLYKMNLFNYFVKEKREVMVGTTKAMRFTMNLEPVTERPANKNKIYTMYGNVSEMCLDTGAVIGGSWKDGTKYYAAHFQKNTDKKYKAEFEFEVSRYNLRYRSAALGFRLASDFPCIGGKKSRIYSERYKKFFRWKKR